MIGAGGHGARLTGMGDQFQGSCTTRTNGYDADSNLTSFTSAVSTPSGRLCLTTTSAPATATSTFGTNVSG